MEHSQLQREHYAAIRLLANERALSRELRRQLAIAIAEHRYRDDFDLDPIVILEEGRIVAAADLIEITAAQCHTLESQQNYHTLKEILTPGPLPRPT